MVNREVESVQSLHQLRDRRPPLIPDYHIPYTHIYTLHSQTATKEILVNSRQCKTPALKNITFIISSMFVDRVMCFHLEFKRGHLKFVQLNDPSLSEKIKQISNQWNHTCGTLTRKNLLCLLK